MNIEEAIAFLSKRQPLKATNDLTQIEIDSYGDILEIVKVTTDEKLLKLLLNAFGDGDCYGLYQMVEASLGNYPKTLVVHLLKEALMNPLPSVKYWTTQIAASFPSTEFIPALTKNLENNCPDIRSSAVTALSCINSPEIPELLRKAKGIENDEYVLEILDSVID